MSTAVDEQQNADPVDPAQPLTSVSVEQLITGRRLNFPINDESGVLLLAAGSLITAKFKAHLRARGITDVELHAEDVEQVTLNCVADDSPPLLTVDSELTDKLDEMIESGKLFVANAGDAFAHEMVFQGCKAYDDEARQNIVETHAQASESLDGLIRDALRGAAVAGDELLDTAGSYLTVMTSDADCVLDTVLEVGRDVDLSKHCLRLALTGMAIGIELGLDEEHLKTLGLCGLVHDWGMIQVAEEIRNAPRLLSDADFVAIKRHPIYSLEMLENVKGLPSEVPLVAYQVHERADGSGYPRTRTESRTHMFARVLGVADAYLALTSPRPHRKAVMPYSAMECIVKQASQGIFDRNVVRALLQAMALFPISSYVVLNDASVARVIRRSGKDFGQPIVQRISASDGSEMEDSEDAIIDLANSEQFEIVQALPTPGKDETELTDAILSPKRPAE